MKYVSLISWWWHLRSWCDNVIWLWILSRQSEIFNILCYSVQVFNLPNHWKFPGCHTVPKKVFSASPQMQNLNGFLLQDAFRIYPLRIDRKPFRVYVIYETRRVIPLNGFLSCLQKYRVIPKSRLANTTNLLIYNTTAIQEYY